MLSNLILITAALVSGDGQSAFTSGPAIGDKLPYRLNVPQDGQRMVCDALE